MRLSEFFQCGFCQCKSDRPFDFPCPARGIHCVELKKRPHSHGKFLWAQEIGFLVFDECHRAGATSSLNADVLISARRQNIKTLMLSATAAETPLGMRAIGYVLKLHDIVGPRGFYPFAMRRGCQRILGRGFQFCVSAERKKKVLLDLHREIWPSRGCRIRIEDLGSAFPDCALIPELVDLDEGGRIQKLYLEMEAPLAALRHRAESDAPGNPLSELLRLRQSVGLLKCPVMADLAREAVADGKHVALFVNFRAEVEALCKLLGTDCFVDGSQTGPRGQTERQANVDAFQRDEQPFIVCNSAAAGVSLSLHDVTGRFPRLGLISLGQSAVGFRQTTGRLRRQGGRSKSMYKVILAAGTVEESVHKKLSARLNNLDALVDGDLLADNLSLT
jgi:hypothetical protein